MTSRSTPAAASSIPTAIPCRLRGNITDGNGPGALTIIDSTGGGVTELAGTNTYSGGTTVINTTLQVTNNASGRHRHGDAR